MLLQPRLGQSRNRLGLDPAEIELPGLLCRGCRDLAPQVVTFGKGLAQQTLHLDDQCASDALGVAVQGLLDPVHAEGETVFPQLLLEDDRQMPRRRLVVTELPGSREIHQTIGRFEDPVLKVGGDVISLLQPASASVRLRGNPVCREEGEQRLVDLTASERLPPCEDVLKRVDLELNAPAGKPLGEHHCEETP